MSKFGGLWKHEKTQYAINKQLGLPGSATLLQGAFLGESDQKFPWEILIGTTKSVHNTTYILEKREVPVDCFD